MKVYAHHESNLPELIKQDIDTQKNIIKTLSTEKNIYQQKLDLFKKDFTQNGENKSQTLAVMRNHFETVLSELSAKQNKVQSQGNLQAKQLNGALAKQNLVWNWILRLINKIMGIEHTVKNLSAELSNNSNQNDEYSKLISLYQKQLRSVQEQITAIDARTYETDDEYNKIYEELTLCENKITLIANKIREIRLNNLLKALEKFEKSTKLHSPLSSCAHTAKEYNRLINTTTKKINDIKETIANNPNEEKISNMEGDQRSIEVDLQRLVELRDQFDKAIKNNEQEARIKSIYDLEAINADMVALDRIKALIFKNGEDNENFFQYIWLGELAQQYDYAKDYASQANKMLNEKKLNPTDFTNNKLLWTKAITNFNRIVQEKATQYPHFAEKIIVKEENNFAISNRIVEIEQGHTGTCLLLSFLQNYIDTKIKRIEDIKQLITINPDGSVKISFPDNRNQLPEKTIKKLASRGYEVQTHSYILTVKINAEKVKEINDNKYSKVKLAQSGHTQEEILYQQYFRCCEAFLGSIFRSADDMEPYNSQIVYEQHVSDREKWVGAIFGYKIQEYVDGFDAISKYIKNNKFNNDTILVLGMRDEEDFAKNAQYENFYGHAWAVRKLDTKNKLHTINPWGHEQIFSKSELINRRPHIYVYVK